jgi:hypothetical protein
MAVSCVVSFGILSRAAAGRVCSLLSCGAEHRRTFRTEDVLSLPSRSVVVASGVVPSLLLSFCLMAGASLEVH